MSGGLVTAAYIVAAILFIFSLAGLSKHETSRQGNNFGIAGMAIALIATIFGPDTGNVGWILLAMVIGGAIGIRLAKKVEMTEMPELVAILHSFVGLAAVLVGFNSYLHHDAGMAPILVNIHLTEVFLGIFIGAVTFTGSVVAFGKLCGKISSKPLMLPNRHKMNLAALVVSFLLLIVFVRTDSVGLQVLALLIMTAIALVFGWHLVASIGGADMPVVVSMLNSYSGWAAAAAQKAPPFFLLSTMPCARMLIWLCTRMLRSAGRPAASARTRWRLSRWSRKKPVFCPCSTSTRYAMPASTMPTTSQPSPTWQMPQSLQEVPC